MFLRSSSSQGIRSGRLHRNIEMSRVDDVVALKLDPDAIHPCARKNKVELNLWPAIGKEWMCVHQVDQIIACGEHVAPGAQIFFRPGGRIRRWRGACTPPNSRALRWKTSTIALRAGWIHQQAEPLQEAQVARRRILLLRFQCIHHTEQTHGRQLFHHGFL